MFKDKHLTATYNFDCIKHKRVVPGKLCAILKRIFSKKFIAFFLLHQLEQLGDFSGV